MTLRPEPQDTAATPHPLRARPLTPRRDPRAAVFVLSLVAASPSGAGDSLRAFAERLLARRAGQR
jgi:hypothetical protein